MGHSSRHSSLPATRGRFYLVTRHSSLVTVLFLLVTCHSSLVTVLSAQGGGPPGGTVNALAIDPSTPATVYAGTTVGGVFKSTNGGTSWTAVNSDLTNTDVFALAIDPSTPATLYAGTNGGVFKSANGGGSWTAVNTGIPINTLVLALAIDPVTPATLYAGTDGSGVFKSINGGTSWTVTGLTQCCIFALAIDPLTPTTLYAGSGTSTVGVFKSTDGGANWVGTPLLFVQALAIDPVNPATLYAAASTLGTTTTVIKTTNGALNWVPVNTGLPFNVNVRALAIDPSIPATLPATLYAGTSFDAAGNPAGVFKSTNGGASWNASNTGLPNNFWVLALTIDPSNPATLYAGTRFGGVFKSTDGGTTWQPTGANSGNGAPPATSISKVSGDNQVGATAKALANPFVVVVTNADGIPVAGVEVTFTIMAGGGTLPGGSPQLVVTDSQGVASTTLTLGATAEANTVTATATGLAGSPVTFTATARLAATLSMVSGDTQSGTAGTALAHPFFVKVTDASSDPVPGVTVTFAVTLGGGSLSATSVTTNWQGQASSLLILGAVRGSNTVTATAADLIGSPLTFTAAGLNKGRGQLISE